MGACQQNSIQLVSEFPLYQPDIKSSASPKAKGILKKFQFGVSSIKAEIPEIAQPIKQRIEQIKPFDYEKCSKHIKGNTIGPCRFENGTIYHGQWQNEKPHGKGKYYIPDGSFFEGTSVQGKIQGYGRIIRANGDYFEGIFQNNLANGQGIYVEGDTTYEGFLVENLQHGVGSQFNEFYKFTGQYFEGQKLKGKLILLNKNYSYEGEFKFNKFHGQGVLIQNNQKYEGEFSKGLKNGKGKLIDATGQYFEGEFKNDQKHGKGKAYNKNSQLLQEEVWKNGKLEEVIFEK